MIKTIWLWSIPQCQCLDEEFKESLLHSFIASRETAAYIPAWGEREAGWEKVWERFTHKWKSIPKPISYETIYVAALCTCRVVETDRKTGATVSWQLCFGFRAGLDSSARSHTLAASLDTSSACVPRLWSGHSQIKADVYLVNKVKAFG